MLVFITNNFFFISISQISSFAALAVEEMLAECEHHCIGMTCFVGFANIYPFPVINGEHVVAVVLLTISSILPFGRTRRKCFTFY